MDKKLVLVGYGKIGSALLKGWLKNKKILPHNIYVVQPNLSSHADLVDFGVCTLSTPENLVLTQNTAIFFAVKPSVFIKIAYLYKRFADRAVFVTAIAGLKHSTYQRLLGEKIKLIRLMPNTPAEIGEGVIGLWSNSFVNKSDLSYVKNFLNENGLVVDVDVEKQLDVITALSGSGPAYLFYFSEILEKIALKNGLSSKLATSLVKQMIYGSSLLSKTSSKQLSQLRKEVTSPNGTTHAALSVMMQEDGLSRLMEMAYLAAYDRSIKLGEEMDVPFKK